jgi:hypothetical protein
VIPREPKLPTRIVRRLGPLLGFAIGSAVIFGLYLVPHWRGWWSDVLSPKGSRRKVGLEFVGTIVPTSYAEPRDDIVGLLNDGAIFTLIAGLLLAFVLVLIPVPEHLDPRFARLNRWAPFVPIAGLGAGLVEYLVARGALDGTGCEWLLAGGWWLFELAHIVTAFAIIKWVALIIGAVSVMFQVPYLTSPQPQPISLDGVPWRQRFGAYRKRVMRRFRKAPNSLPQPPKDNLIWHPPEAWTAPTEIGVCCSGGGVRSAAFSLGALRALERDGVLRQTRTLTAISGGNYAATGWVLAKHRIEKGSPRPSFPPGPAPSSDSLIEHLLEQNPF